MDPLSRIIALMQPKAVAWRELSVAGARTVRFPATEMVAFGHMLEGAAIVETAEGKRTPIEAGDFVLLAAPRVWMAHLQGGGPVIDLKTLFEAPPGLGEATRFVAGAFEFGAPNSQWLARLAPAFLHISGAEVETGRLGGLLRMLADEVRAERPGRSLVLDRLLEIILVEAIRSDASPLAEPKRGLLAGLTDARLRTALRALHEAPQSGWTVAALAREAGMSRSSFAARFAEIVGEPPIDYLVGLRMQVAKAALKTSPAPLSRVAALSGYGSVSAFSTAFRRQTGMTPGDFLRRGGEAGAARP